MDILCLQEQFDQSSIKLLLTAVRILPSPLAELAREGWQQPLVVRGDVLLTGFGRTLVHRAPNNVAPLLILPPLMAGDMTSLLDASAPVTVVRRRTDTLEVVDDELRETLGRASLHIYCTDSFETALKSGILVASNGLPIIWAYQSTHAATPIVWVGAQLLLVSARTDPIDREDLLLALLKWAETKMRKSGQAKPTEVQPADTLSADPALLRALVVARCVRPDLTSATLPEWLAQHLFRTVGPDVLNEAIDAYQPHGPFDQNGTPNTPTPDELKTDRG